MRHGAGVRPDLKKAREQYDGAMGGSLALDVIDYAERLERGMQPVNEERTELLRKAMRQRDALAESLAVTMTLCAGDVVVIPRLRGTMRRLNDLERTLLALHANARTEDSRT